MCNWLTVWLAEYLKQCFLAYAGSHWRTFKSQVISSPYITEVTDLENRFGCFVKVHTETKTTTNQKKIITLETEKYYRNGGHQDRLKVESLTPILLTVEMTLSGNSFETKRWIDINCCCQQRLTFWLTALSVVYFGSE